MTVPGTIATEIVQDLEAGLEQVREIEADLKECALKTVLAQAEPFCVELAN